MKSVLFAAALLLVQSAEASTVKYKGQDYAGTLDTGYFLDNPTAVGGTRTLRFYDSYCAGKAADMADRGEPLDHCDLDYAGMVHPDPSASFFSFAVDGFRGAPLKRTWFFSITFSPTAYIDPLVADFDEYLKLIGEIYITYDWGSMFGGNNSDRYLTLEGAVIPPAPVPLPASGAVAALGLAALSAYRRKRRA